MEADLNPLDFDGRSDAFSERPCMPKINLSNLLDTQQTAQSAFAVVTLGVLEALASGTMAADDATRFYFHADNCLFVRKHLDDKTANEVMSRGVQLQDLFDALPPREAQQEFQRELTAIRFLCLQLLDRQEVVAS